jgi:hypothetical protein
MPPEALGILADRPAAPHRLRRCEKSNEASPTYLSPRLVRGPALQRAVCGAPITSLVTSESPEPVLCRESMGLDQACLATTTASGVREARLARLLRAWRESLVRECFPALTFSRATPSRLGSGWSCTVAEFNCCMPYRLAWA